ncbi:MAG TPA: YgiQ family radical SAM protein [Malonomonas sp.]
MKTANKDQNFFLPMSRAEMNRRGWQELDVLLVSGDAYVDHPAFGIPLLGRFLEEHGFRVGIIAQPDWRDPEAFKVMGRPRLCAAISAGAMDSMVNHYTAARKKRRDDAYTPGGRAGARPNRAVIAYTAAVKGAFKGLPVIIGGIEASLRRVAHYDYWDDSVRRSVLVDSKADLLVYGMGERALLEIVSRAAQGEAIADLQDVRGTACFTSLEPKATAIVLPSFEAVSSDQAEFLKAFKLAATEMTPFAGRTLYQQHGRRWVQINPPATPLSEAEMDQLYQLPFLKRPHPSYAEAIPAFTQIRFSLTTHRGCFGGCAFCAISTHQGKTIQSRSEASVLAEVDRLAKDPEFSGTISDVGGPTANMYGLCCGNPTAEKVCRRSDCLFPQPCSNLIKSDVRAVDLLNRIRVHPGVRHAFVASGIRYDLLEHQQDYFEALLEHHVGGLLKVAPETASSSVAKIMRKPGPQAFSEFLQQFRETSQQLNLRQGVVPYFIAAHPGCTLSDMLDTALFLRQHNLKVEQVQEFTPTPGSVATCMYYTGKDPFTGNAVYIPRSANERRLQKAVLLWHLPENRRDILEALKLCGREKDARLFLDSVRPKGQKR